MAIGSYSWYLIVTLTLLSPLCQRYVAKRFLLLHSLQCDNIRTDTHSEDGFVHATVLENSKINCLAYVAISYVVAISTLMTQCYIFNLLFYKYFQELFIFHIFVEY